MLRVIGPTDPNEPTQKSMKQDAASSCFRE